MNIESIINFITKQKIPLLYAANSTYIRKLKTRIWGIFASVVSYKADIPKLAMTIGLIRNSAITYLQNLNRAEHKNYYPLTFCKKRKGPTRFIYKIQTYFVPSRPPLHIQIQQEKHSS